MRMISGLIGASIITILLIGSNSAAQVIEYTGTVVGKAGRVVTVRLDSAPVIDGGAALGVYKFFTKNLFGMETTGWLHAAEGKLKSLKGSVAVVQVTEEKSSMVVNGKKVEHLTAGTKVKLVLK
ncbi:MAG: hypothetical protein KA369_00490 [Spirochaetes bacterium]|nr:hypothetical protein [Spirochaetota bacterium]